MPVCPNCHKDFRARKNNACPGCAIPVSLYKGKWHRTDDGAPALVILRYFERLVSKKQSQSRGIPIVFRIPPKGRRRRLELVFANRLLNEADDEVDLVKRALDLLFFDGDFNFKTRTSLVDIQRDFTLALSIAKAQAAAERLAALKKQETFDQVMQREDIFN